MSPYNPQLNPTEQVYVTCISVKEEAKGIKTFKLSYPMNGSQSFKYKPGQFASFDFLGLEGGDTITNRTWTISSHPSTYAYNDYSFSITVKKAGLISSWLHNQLQPGMQLRFRGVEGDFTSIPGSLPVCLLAAGIGITPLRAMLPDMLKAAADVVLLYSVRYKEEAAFLQEFLDYTHQYPNFRVHLFITQSPPGTLLPSSRDQAVQHGDNSSNSNTRKMTAEAGRINKTTLCAHVPDVSDRLVYLCGPDAFMEGMRSGLLSLGVAEGHILQESFTF
jgi:ferredoxin-NADP reductase